MRVPIDRAIWRTAAVAGAIAAPVTNSLHDAPTLSLAIIGSITSLSVAFRWISGLRKARTSLDLVDGTLRPPAQGPAAIAAAGTVEASRMVQSFDDARRRLSAGRAANDIKRTTEYRSRNAKPRCRQPRPERPSRPVKHLHVIADGPDLVADNHRIEVRRTARQRRRARPTPHNRVVALDQRRLVSVPEVTADGAHGAAVHDDRQMFTRGWQIRDALIPITKWVVCICLPQLTPISPETSHDVDAVAERSRTARRARRSGNFVTAVQVEVAISNL